MRQQEPSVDCAGSRGLTLGAKAVASLSKLRSDILRPTFSRRSDKPRKVDSRRDDLLLSKINQKKYAIAVDFLQEIPTELALLGLGVEGWKQSRNRYGYIQLADDSFTEAFLTLLRIAGFTGGDLTVCIQKSDLANGHHAELLKEKLNSLFMSAMVSLPGFEMDVPFHPTRPPAFLQWNTQKAISKDVYAASDLKGLDALMQVLYVYLEITTVGAK